METQSHFEDNVNVDSGNTEQVCEEKTLTKTSSNTENFDRSRVEALDSKIRLVDSDDETGLDLFCYTHCDRDDDEFLRQCRGLVYHNNKLVMKAFPYTPEYGADETEQLEKLFTNFGMWTFYDAHEGSLLRLFYFAGRWYLSTHRKLNAFRSKWASHDSFGTLFKQALNSELEHNQKFRSSLPDGENILDRFQNTLDKSKQYMFLLCNNKDNRIVCKPPENPKVFHVGTFVDGKLNTDDTCVLDFPKKHNFLNIDQMLDHVSKLNHNELQGLVAFGHDNVQIKVLLPSYKNLFRIRGNQPSIKFQYLNVRMKKEDREALYDLYPEHVSEFEDYEECLYVIAQSIHQAYVQRFIKKKRLTVPLEEYQIMVACHTWHCSDRQNNRITLDKVITEMNKQTPTNLNRMIRRHKTTQSKRKEAHPRSYPTSVESSPAVVPMIPSLSPKAIPLSHGKLLKKGVE